MIVLLFFDLRRVKSSLTVKRLVKRVVVRLSLRISSARIERVEKSINEVVAGVESPSSKIRDRSESVQKKKGSVGFVAFYRRERGRVLEDEVGAEE